MRSFSFPAVMDDLLFCARLRYWLRLLTISLVILLHGSDWSIAQNPRLVLQPEARESIHARLDRDQLEELLYGTLGGSKQAFRRSKKESFQRYIDRIDQVCDLSDEQLNKIQSAIEIEIARWESRVTALLCEITPNTEPAQKQAIFTQAWSKALEFQNEPRDTESTVWYKTLLSTLNPDQLRQLAADRERLMIRERAVSRYRVLLLLQRSLGLNKSQREAISNLLEQPSSDPNSEEIISLGQLCRFLQTRDRNLTALSPQQWERLEAIAAADGAIQIRNRPEAEIVVP